MSTETIHGVVIDPKTMTVDVAATEKLRAKIRAERPPLEVTTPNRAGAAHWTEERLRPGDEYLIDPQYRTKRGA